MNPQSIFPADIFRTTTLSNVAVPVTGIESGRQIGGIRIVGGAAAEVVIFRRTGAGATYFTIPVGIGAYVESDIRWYADGGLEILTATVAGDVEVVIHFN